MDGDNVQQSDGSLGPIIGTIIILLVIILGGLYFWSERTKNTAPTESAATAGSDKDIQAVQTQSSSDDLNAIQADLNATNVNSVDASLK